MEDCPKPCINNDYAEDTKLFNILSNYRKTNKC